MELFQMLGLIYLFFAASAFILDAVSIIWDHLCKREHESFLAEFLSDSDPWWRAILRIVLFVAGVSYFL